MGLSVVGSRLVFLRLVVVIRPWAPDLDAFLDLAGGNEGGGGEGGAWGDGFCATISIWV